MAGETTSTSKTKSSTRGHEIAAKSVTAVSAYTCLQIISENGATNMLDLLTVHSYLMSALTQFLGLTGAAISFDILKVENDICWIRLAREDLGTFLAAVASWNGTILDRSRVCWRVKAKGNWLSSLLAIDSLEIWND
ncbi:hypothetical protein K3495_g3138 [Podosphaera aphanis]|nr:hypothetical protein K3495_g3138 [Podosphaera aphanis]